MGDTLPSFFQELTRSKHPNLRREPAPSFQFPSQPPARGSESSPTAQHYNRRDHTDDGTTGPRNKRKDASQGQRRNKYIPRACQDCQRRKVKCSGEDICYHCRSRDVQCVYLPKPEADGRRKRTRATSLSSRGNEGNGADTTVIEKGKQNSVCDESTTSIESKIEMLQEQMKAFAENRGFMDGNERHRLAFTSAALYTLDLAAENGDETDTFNNGTGSNNLSLSAQLADLQKILRLSSGLTRRVPQNSGWNRVFPLELPRPQRLRYLLGVYFREMDSFFPVLDQELTTKRLFKALDALGYSDCNLIIDVDTAHYPGIALLCNLLVLGECQDPEIKGCDDPRPGWALYHRGRKLIQHCGSSKTLDIDLICYHTLSALYMMDSELLQSAAYAISTAVHLAMVARLNDQSLWGNCSPEECQARQRLWWTIYFLDRRIAQRSGTPYIIRDNEIAVDEFEVSRVDKDRAETPNALSKMFTENYLQSLVDFSKLWGPIWDTFYAASANKGGDWREIALTDTRMLIYRRSLPSELTWETERAADYMRDGETEPRVRRRLAIFIRINLLRMIIRQNPILSCDGDEEARSFCAHLARSSIDAIAAFGSVYARGRSSGYFISTALVECIYHLVYILQDRSLQIDRIYVLESFRKAYQLLSDFAGTWITAKRALRALSSVISSGGDANALFEAISKPQSEGSERLHDSPSDGALIFESYPDTSFADLLFTAPSDQSAGADLLAAPTLDQLADQILEQDSQRQMHQNYSTGQRFTDYVPKGLGDIDLDCAQIFSNL